jgi:hypothetical protein
MMIPTSKSRLDEIAIGSGVVVGTCKEDDDEELEDEEEELEDEEEELEDEEEELDDDVLDDDEGTNFENKHIRMTNYPCTRLENPGLRIGCCLELATTGRFGMQYCRCTTECMVPTLSQVPCAYFERRSRVVAYR